MDDAFYSFDSPKYKAPDDRSLSLYDPVDSGLLASGAHAVESDIRANGGDTEDSHGYGGPFAIRINGTSEENENGVKIQSQNFNIDVLGGNATYPTQSSPVVFSGKSENVSANNDFYRIYAEVRVSKSTGSDVYDNFSDAAIRIEEAATADPVGSNTRYVNNGNGSYTYYFLIGTVGVAKDDDGVYRVFISQTQIGDYKYGENEGDASDSNGNDTRDGVRTVTICIQGKPYYADIEMTNIVAVD